MPTITALPARATEPGAKGIFPPLLRAVTHVGFAIALIQAELHPDEGTTARIATPAELTSEIDHIAQHWALVIRPTYINPDTLAALTTLSEQVTTLHQSVTADTKEILLRNLQAFLRGVLGTAVLLDTSVFGLAHPAQTDAGTEL